MWDILGANEESIPSNWIELESVDDLENALENSYNKPIVLFKHSTHCGISLSAKRRLAKEYDTIDEEIGFYYLDLIQNRTVSNLIAEQLDGIHQSPQVILIKDNKVLFHGSHEGVSIGVLRSALNQS